MLIPHGPYFREACMGESRLVVWAGAGAFFRDGEAYAELRGNDNAFLMSRR